MNESIVIIGAGHAAGQLVASLTQDGFKGAVTLVGQEAHPPYQRPPLSKKFLAGEVTLDRLYFRPPAFYDKSGVRLVLDTRAVAIDQAARTVATDGGAALPYTTLVLATGSRPRTLPLAGLPDYVARVGIYRDLNAAVLRLTPAALAEMLVAELTRAGAVRIESGHLLRANVGRKE